MDTPTSSDTADVFNLDVAQITEAWKDGDMSGFQAIRLLGESYHALMEKNRATIAAYQAYEQAEKRLKDAGKEIVMTVGQTHAAAGFTWKLVETREKVVWNTAALDKLVMRLLQNGQDELARHIAEARSVEPGTCYVRLDRDKEKAHG